MLNEDDVHKLRFELAFSSVPRYNPTFMWCEGIASVSPSRATVRVDGNVTAISRSVCPDLDGRCEPDHHFRWPPASLWHHLSSEGVSGTEGARIRANPRALQSQDPTTDTDASLSALGATLDYLNQRARPMSIPSVSEVARNNRFSKTATS